MSRAKVREWLCVHALPLWADAGLDAQMGGFVERLGTDGAPDHEAPKRSVVQARQIYVYSHAALAGLMPEGASVAAKGFHFLMRHACDGQPGLAHVMDRRGAIIDSVRDTYDHAFFLFAFAWYYRAGGGAAAVRAMDRVLAMLDRLRDPSGEGYAEDDSGRLPRRQNPHMHLLEAFLAAYIATGREDMLVRASEIVALLERRFFVNGMLREYFAGDLSSASLPAGAIVEPGHHFEWVWLLDQYERLSGAPAGTVLLALHEAAMRMGNDRMTGLSYNELWAGGGVKDDAKRLWPQTEALKSALAMARRAGVDSAEQGIAAVDRIFRHFLDPAPAGAWIDRLDALNRPINGPIPASSFYHVFVAFYEYLR